MEKEILLSICIPTYNRDKFLLEAIDSIVVQLTEDLIDKVEICISDNASTDSTELYIDSYILKHPKLKIKYKKNEKNMGADYNFIKVIDIAEGKFCWYLGSDDSLEQGALQYVISKIKENEKVSVFMGTNNIYDFNLSKKIENEPQHPSILSKKYNCDTLIDNINEISKDALNAFGYLSVLIFSREKWNSIDGYEKYYGTAYVHMYKLFKIVSIEKKLYYIRKEIVKYRSGNDFFAQDLKKYRRALLDIKGYKIITNDVFNDANIRRNIIKSVIKVYLVNHTRGMIEENTKNKRKYFYLLLKEYWTYLDYWKTCFIYSLLIATINSKVLRHIKKVFN